MLKRIIVLSTLISHVNCVKTVGIPHKGEQIPVNVVWHHLINWFKKCSFDAIVTPDTASQAPKIVFDKNGTIITITDGKKSGLYLSNMPQSQKHFRRLRKAANLGSTALIGLYTLNTADEQQEYKLKQRIAVDSHMRQHEYPTLDFTAPTMVDLIRGVRDLDMRDSNQEAVACVHCKAGMGRSVTLVIAYLLYVYTLATKECSDNTIQIDAFDNQAVIEKITQYVKMCRPVIRPNKDQKKIIAQFYDELTATGSFDALCEKYAAAITTRDIVCDVQQNLHSIVI